MGINTVSPFGVKFIHLKLVLCGWVRFISGFSRQITGIFRINRIRSKCLLNAKERVQAESGLLHKLKLLCESSFVLD
ncbi:hypothetical protein D3C78_1648410 [compost metagenome]